MAAELPEIDLNKPAEEVRRQFEKALEDIRAQLQEYLLSDGKRYDLEKAEREIEKILASLDEYIDENTTSFLETIATAAVFIALYEMLKPVDSVASVKFSRKEKAMLDYASSTLANDLKQVVANLKRQATMVLKRAYFETLARTAERTKRALSADAKRLLDEADIAIVDKAGRRWKTSTYVELVVKENLVRAQRELEVLESLRNGNGLAYVSYHPKTTDGCKQHQYRIVSVSPDSDTIFPYYKNLDHIWHVNCRHHLVPIVNLESIPAQVKRKNGL